MSDSQSEQTGRVLRDVFLKYLTEDSETKDARRKEFNQAIFNAQEGWAVFNGTDLEMVMAKFDKAQLEQDQPHKPLKDEQLREEIATRLYELYYIEKDKCRWKHVESLIRKVYLSDAEQIQVLIRPMIDKAKRDFIKWGDEPCPHRNSDFPRPDHVPEELQLKKSDCRDCRQSLSDNSTSEEKE